MDSLLSSVSPSSDSLNLKLVMGPANQVSELGVALGTPKRHLMSELGVALGTPKWHLV